MNPGPGEITQGQLPTARKKLPLHDVMARYGTYPQSKWDANMELKSYFEKKTGRNIYDVVEKEHFRP